MKTAPIVFFAVFFFHASAWAADKIRIGIPSPAAQFVTFSLAQKKGFFKEEGLEAEIIQMRGNVPMAALVNGDIDYYTVVGSGVRSAIRGLPLKVLACYVPGLPLMLIARPEFKSVKELQGKSIGVGAYGATTDVIARMIFKHFGLDPDKDVKFIAGGEGPARLNAMNQGLFAATVTSAPGDSQGAKMGFHVLVRAFEIFSYPNSGILANVKKIKERPDEAKRVIKAGIKANRYIRQNREGTAQVLTDWLKIDNETATATYDSIAKAFNDDGSLPESGLRLLIDEAKRDGKVTREVSFSEVADLSILLAAQKELGIRGK
jgi:NitT/TauT family transport system substrate-binding protein